MTKIIKDINDHKFFFLKINNHEFYIHMCEIVDNHMNFTRVFLNV